MSYADQARTRKWIGTALEAALLDFDADGSEDAGVYAEAALMADADIDAALAQRYVVPFTTTYPARIVSIANILTAAYFLDHRHSEAADRFRAMAQDKLDRLADGTDDMPGVAKVAANEGKNGISYQARTPVFGMTHTDDEDDEDLSDSSEGIF